MMTKPDPSWKLLGSTITAQFYAIADDIMGIVPYPDSTDTLESARASIGFQDKHWRAVGHRGAVVVFMDNIAQQGAEARAVYADEVDALPSTCFALVGESFYGYASSQVFTGLRPPGRPTNIFRSLADAMPWMKEMNEKNGGPL
jgi:hypothetical protein